MRPLLHARPIRFPCTPSIIHLIPTYHRISFSVSAPHTVRRQLRMASTLPRIPLFEDISKHDPRSTAVVHSDSGRTFTYDQLLGDVAHGRRKLAQETAKGKSLEGERVAFLVENGYDYVGARNSVISVRVQQQRERKRAQSSTGVYCRSTNDDIADARHRR